jgi:hypothetical protein
MAARPRERTEPQLQIAQLDAVRAAVTEDVDAVPAVWAREGYTPPDAETARKFAGWKARAKLSRMIEILADLAEHASRDSVRRAAASDLFALASETNSDREDGSDEKPHPTVVIVQNGADLRAELERRMGDGK